MSSVYYTRMGDTLSKIMDKYNCTFKELEKINNLTKLKILKGQMILVPISDEGSIRLYQYSAEDEDTLDKIMKQYRIKYEEIKYFNNLTQLILIGSQEINVLMKVISPVENIFEK